MQRRTNSTVVKWIAWAALLLGLVVGFIAHPFDWYGRVWWLDDVLHAFTSAAIAVVVSLYLPQQLIARVSDRQVLRFTLVFCVTITVGVAWELAEWLYDMLTGANTSKDKRDMMFDFCMDAAGAATGALIGLRLAPRQQPV